MLKRARRRIAGALGWFALFSMLLASLIHP
jgi:hypothetical protein